MASGGVSAVTCPVQGSAFVTTQASDYTGTFNQPVVTNGATNAEFNLKLIVTPIPFLGMEGAVQINAAVVPIVEARMNDAGNSATDYLATKLFNNATDGLDIVGLPGAVDDTGLYGNIDGTTETFWRAKVYDLSPSEDPTRGQHAPVYCRNGAQFRRRNAKLRRYGSQNMGEARAGFYFARAIPDHPG